MNDDILWRPAPARVAASNLTAFMQHVNAREQCGVTDYEDLHAWSLREREAFWRNIIDFVGLKASTWGTAALTHGDRMPGARFFPEARLNYARNLLRRDDDRDALVFWGEDRVRRRITWRELRDDVSRLAQALREAGVGPGDRVAGYLPNIPEAVVAMLASVSLGATWSSCSPDFGVQGVLDRFGQITPKVLFAADGYFYAGKAHDCLGKLREIIDRLPSIQQAIVVSYLGSAADTSGIPKGVPYAAAVDLYAEGEIHFAELPFDHPLYVMFSSGTTGVPKCIVHGAGGTLLKQASEHVLNCDIKPGDRVFYFTTCSWMMWNWLVGALAAEATLLLYDGSPFHPSGNVLFDLADSEGMTMFGTSAKYIDALIKAGLKPRQTHDLSTLKTMTSTGSPLLPESFEYVYTDVKSDMHLASMSGGTDILGCFVIGDPTSPVRKGEIQRAALGMATGVLDESGNSVRGEKGELVCTAAFPSMPIGFWDDPAGERYRAAYFERFPGVWHHGDYVEWTPNGGFVIYGRSDATLNPGGVRIGTAEIYRQVEILDEIKEALVIGQNWDGDVRIVLFVVLRDGLTLDDDLTARVRAQIRSNCTPRHVPAKVVQVSDLPRTKSGKITELAVRDVVHGKPVQNVEALANPESLEQFRDVPELQH